MAIQQLMLGVGAAKKTYMDDVFSTYLYDGNGSTRSINNGLDLSGEGGLVWIKKRNGSNDHVMGGTSIGDNKYLSSNNQDYAHSSTGRFRSLESTGFEIGDNTLVNASSNSYSSWSFRKAKGFFDVVSYTGNGTARTIAHSLGSVPGMIIVKKTSHAGSWAVYHRDLSAATHYLALNSNNEQANNTNFWNGTHPTSTHFSVGTDADVNTNGATYVAYVFAGGESTAATARCVEMDGSDYFDTSTSSDYTFGTGDFTVETWFRVDEDYSSNANYPTIADARTDGSYTNFWVVYIDLNKNIKFYNAGADKITSNVKIERGQWYHMAVVRNSGVTQLYVNGTSQGTYSDSTDYSNSSFRFGANAVSAGYHFDGAFSNLRVVKGTAVYTASFRPPTAPLTNITNTKLLCFNNSSTTGTTVGTITATGDSTASTDSPFDDPAAFKFGDSKEGIIKCGSYVGADSSTEVNLGFEPQLLLIKKTSGTGDWHIFDSMRGMVDGSNDAYLYLNGSYQEDNTNVLRVTPTGFKFETTVSALNGDGGDFVYLAIRRPDGYVGKPAEAGTDVFAMDTGSGSATIPTYDSGFPVDFSFQRTPDSSLGWWTYARLIQGRYMSTNSSDAEANDGGGSFDSNVGYSEGSGRNSSYQAWMWKRHAGLDVVTTGPGTGTGMVIKHNLGKTPEMIWAKKRATSNWSGNSAGGEYPLDRWFVWHKDGDAVNAIGYLNRNTGSGLSMVYSGSVNSVSAQFHSNVTYTDDENLMIFFASVDGISKVGSYTGNESSSGPTITLGFAPRFILIKGAVTGTDWFVLDTTRGLDSGSDKRLSLNSSNAQETGSDLIDPSSTGFQVTTSWDQFNGNNQTFYYYAHA